MGWIDKAIKKPGSLRKSLGVKGDDPIPEGKLEAAAEKGGKLGQRARLAQTLKEMNMSKHGMKPNYEKHHEAQETPAQEAYERRTGNEAQHLYKGKSKHGMQMGTSGYGTSHGCGITHEYTAAEKATHGCSFEHGFGKRKHPPSARRRLVTHVSVGAQK